MVATACAVDRRGTRRVRRRARCDAAGRGRLGHRRTADGGAAARNGPPDRLPDIRPARLAGVRAASAVRRAGLPDEPPVRALPGRSGRPHGGPGPIDDPFGAPRCRRRSRDGPHAGRLGGRHTRRGTRAAPPAGRAPAAPARCLGVEDSAGGGGPSSRSPRRPRPRRPRRPLPDRGHGRVRAGRRQPFADAAPGTRGRSFRARGEPRDLDPPEARADVHRGPRHLGRRRLSRAPATCRSLPGTAGLRAARHLGGVLVRRTRPAIPGQPVGPVRRSAGQGRPARRSDGWAVRGARAAHPDRVRADRRPSAALRAADGRGRRVDLLLRGVVRERRHRALLPGAGPHGLDVAGNPGSRRGRSAGRRARDAGSVRHLRPARPWSPSSPWRCSVPP